MLLQQQTSLLLQQQTCLLLQQQTSKHASGPSKCAENEFLAEETLVEIEPSFDHLPFHFISVRVLYVCVIVTLCDIFYDDCHLNYRLR